MDDLRWRPTSKLAYATRKARGSAGQKLLLRKVRFWRKADTWLVSCFSMFQRISASPPQIRSGELDDLVGTSIENGLQHVKREALRHLRGYFRRHCQLHAVDDCIDEHRTGMSQGLGELLLHLRRILDAYALDADGLSHGREVRIDKLGSGVEKAGRLLFELDEADRRIARSRDRRAPCALGVVFQRGVEMASIALGDETRQQPAQGGAHLADQTKLDRSPTTNRLCPDVDLGDAGILREELAIGEISAQHQKRVAGFHGLVPRGEADQAGHSDVVGIFPLDMLFASQGVDDRRLQGFGELRQLVMRALAAAAAEQCDAPGVVEEIGELVERLIGGHDN